MERRTLVPSRCCVGSNMIGEIEIEIDSPDRRYLELMSKSSTACLRLEPSSMIVTR